MFISYFWKALWVTVKTKLHFSTAYHPLTVVVDRSLGQLLRCLVHDHITARDHVLPMAEFAYNNSVNCSTSIPPFEAVTGVRLRLPIDLVPLPLEARPSVEANNFINHIQ
eukprot:TRINITY_DN4436_c0_g4_i1.p1 TRINITY_DN4436_c0_g4~~TRINITY_DN4436_c0_g4_i1.p1  ORF type:complete len:110 (-),score=12.84 TRINITY_DN4436_c0_g4_i1:424-753(-)